MLTWRGCDGDRLEQVRLLVNDHRIKAYGRVIGAATADHEAFSASYDLVTDDAGVTRRFSVHLLRESGEMQISVSRDTEGNWLVQTPRGTERGSYGGAEDVELALSPFFNSLPIRRLGLVRAAQPVDVPVVYLYLPGGTANAETLRYQAADAGGVAVSSPLGASKLSVDEHGFVRDYQGLADRL